MVKDKRLSAFVNYCWKFYGPKGVYGNFFGHTLTKVELIAACELRMVSDANFCGDTVDREAVREMLIFARQYATGAGFDGQVNLFKRLNEVKV